MADPTIESPEQAVQKWLRGEITARELFALNDQTIQALADHGYMLYENGKYRKAAVVFEALSAFDNANPNYQKILGIHLSIARALGRGILPLHTCGQKPAQRYSIIGQPGRGIAETWQE